LAFQVGFSRRHSYAGPDDTITLPVVLHSGEQSIDLIASLDTGASHCLFQRRYAEILGLEVELGVPMSFATANSRFQAYGHEVMIGTLDLEIYSLVFFFADTTIVKNVLGRHGWLDRMTVGIADHSQLLFVAAYDESVEC
jgi:hypothetical protein